MSFAWLAGLIDAEGCIRAFRSTSNKNTVRGAIQLSMVDVEPLRKAACVYREIYGKKPKIICSKLPSGKINYRIIVYCKNQLRKVVYTLGKYLEGKKAEAYELLNAISQQTQANIDRLKYLKRNPEPSCNYAEGVETRQGAPTDEELDWLAGFLDGDGSINYKCHQITFTNTNKANIDKVISIVKRLTGYSPKVYIKEAVGNWRKRWQVTICNREACDTLLKALLPQLTNKLPAACLFLASPHRGEGRVQGQSLRNCSKYAAIRQNDPRESSGCIIASLHLQSRGKQNANPEPSRNSAEGVESRRRCS